MSAVRICLLAICWWLGASPMAFAWQSCPQPQGYDSHRPVLIKRPGFGGLSTPAATAVARIAATPLTGDYRPADLLGWTSSPSECTASSTDDAPCGAHRVYVPAATTTPREPLVVFLPGSSMSPRSHDLVLKTAAYAGYRTIGLSYDSTHNVDSMCTIFGLHRWCGVNDCYAPKRDEIILGADFSGDLHVEPADSILERLFTLLAALYTDDISDGVNDHGWDAYFTPVNAVPVPIRVDNIVWDSVVIAGFSQGAGHAARISKEYRVHGTIMIDGPGDMCYDGLDLVAAQWMDGPDASAGQPRYGAMHGVWSELFNLEEGEAPPTWDAMDITDNGLVSLDEEPIDGTPHSLAPGGIPDFLPDIDLDRYLPPAAAVSTDQVPASATGSDAQCLAIPSLGLPDDVSQKHGSMADDRCMPTTRTDGVLASRPSDAYLFEHYLKRFCYACEQGLCP